MEGTEEILYKNILHVSELAIGLLSCLTVNCKEKTALKTAAFRTMISITIN